MFAPVLLGLLAAHASAQEPRIAQEEWRVVGWNDACGVAFTVLDYPKLGEAIAGDPISTRCGTQEIEVGQEKAAARWTLEADGAQSWDAKALADAESALRADGFERKGYPEAIAPGSDEVLASTTTLSSRLRRGWPGPEWRFSEASYNPLGTCALLAFEKAGSPRRRFLLTRMYNPAARKDRAAAHVARARSLFDAGNIDDALAEAAGASRLAPELGLARYSHAALLALTGRSEAAVQELAAAVKADPKLRAQAIGDQDFESLRDRDDFRDATH